jgi:hypothetical protein
LVLRQANRAHHHCQRLVEDRSPLGAGPQTLQTPKSRAQRKTRRRHCHAHRQAAHTAEKYFSIGCFYQQVEMIALHRKCTTRKRAFQRGFKSRIAPRSVGKTKADRNDRTPERKITCTGSDARCTGRASCRTFLRFARALRPATSRRPPHRFGNTKHNCFSPRRDPPPPILRRSTRHQAFRRPPFQYHEFANALNSNKRRFNISENAKLSICTSTATAHSRDLDSAKFVTRRIRGYFLRQLARLGWASTLQPAAPVPPRLCRYTTPLPLHDASAATRRLCRYTTPLPLHHASAAAPRLCRSTTLWPG